MDLTLESLPGCHDTSNGYWSFVLPPPPFLTLTICGRMIVLARHAELYVPQVAYSRSPVRFSTRVIGSGTPIHGPIASWSTLHGHCECAMVDRREHHWDVLDFFFRVFKEHCLVGQSLLQSVSVPTVCSESTRIVYTQDDWERLLWRDNSYVHTGPFAS